MNIKNKKLLKRIKEKPIDPLWLDLRRLESSKMLYAQNPNLLPNVRMANVYLVQNDIIAFKKKLKKENQRYCLKEYLGQGKKGQDRIGVGRRKRKPALIYNI